jgi:teichuronic acid biosynthesis glycosyltransferase TuaG
MVLKRSIIETIRFPKVKSLEDYCFKCKILKKGHNAVKLKQNLMFYRISKNSLSGIKFRNLYWLWHINKKYNRLSLAKSIKSTLLISINSIKKYGFK